MEVVKRTLAVRLNALLYRKPTEITIETGSETAARKPFLEVTFIAYYEFTLR